LPQLGRSLKGIKRRQNYDIATTKNELLTKEEDINNILLYLKQINTM
jgi:hypothetical protein